MKKVISLCLSLVIMLIFSSAFATGQPTDPLLNPIGTLPVVKEPVTITIGVLQDSTVLDYEDNALTKLIEEKTGIDIELVFYPQLEGETKLMLQATAGTKLPDIITFGITDASLRNQLASAGALLPLDDYFDEETGLTQAYYENCARYDIDPSYPIDMNRSTDGKLYAMPHYGAFLANMYDYRAWINQDWLDALGLEKPTTIDELTEVLIAFRDGDPNGNGIKDEIPLTAASASDIKSNDNPFSWLQNLFIFRDQTGNLFLPLCDTDGKLDVSYDKPEYREMLKYVNMLVKEDLLDEAAFTQTRSEMRAQLQADTQTIGMMFGSANGFGQNIASWQPLEMPIGYYGERIVSVENPVPGVSSAISADCEHPEVAFALLNLGYTSDLGNFFWVYSARYGEKDVDWVYADPNADSIFKELGIKPSLKQLQMTWGVETKSHWQVSFFPSIYAGDFAIEEFDGNEAHGERLHGRSVAMNMPYAPAVSDVVPASLLYTDEERDEWDSVRSALQSYIIESSALFSVGQWDPNDDTAWQSYLDELNVLRYKDLIAVDQAVYNRTMGIE